MSERRRTAPQPQRLDAISEIAALLQRAGALKAQGNLVGAESCLQQALRRDPRNAAVLNAFGNLAVSRQRYEVAIDYHQRAAKAAPKDAVVLNDLANSLLLAGEPQRALPNLRKALKIQPRLRAARFNLARAYRDLNDPERSLAVLDKIEATEGGASGNIDVMLERAVTLAQIGRSVEAAGLFRSVLKARPADPKAIDGLATGQRASRENSDLDLVKAALAEARLTPLQRAVAHRSAGKMLEDIGSYDEAFEHFRQANEAAGTRFDMQRHEAFVTRGIRLFTPAFFEQRTGFGHSSEQPVFVVGLPRSGTTLVEQILASHPEVAGLGELPDIERGLLKATGSPLASPGLFDSIAALASSDIRKAARDYLETLKQRGGGKPRAIDKMPHNFLALGWIALLFPKARVIHVRRDPLDVCVSLYSHHVSDAHAYSNDLRTLGEYYRSYERLMRHWAEVLPLAMLDMRYEDLVADLEGSSRGMVAHLGLEWSPACLDFFRNSRVVQTPSRWQVRQPIYASSVGRWRRYEHRLRPLIEALN